MLWGIFDMSNPDHVAAFILTLIVLSFPIVLPILVWRELRAERAAESDRTPGPQPFSAEHRQRMESEEREREAA